MIAPTKIIAKPRILNAVASGISSWIVSISGAPHAASMARLTSVAAHYTTGSKIAQAQWSSLLSWVRQRLTRDG